VAGFSALGRIMLLRFSFAVACGQSSGREVAPSSKSKTKTTKAA
jgi:hypothetical protein